MTGVRNKDKAVFGPVPSRRLGMSLGVDLLVPKTCTLNCVYCECGPTPQPTTTRGRFRDPALVLEQVALRLAQLDHPPDYITLAGWGEPTLSLDLGLVLEGLRPLSPARLAVLTNGTLGFDPQVRAELALADVVVPSLDAVSPQVFARINRPAPGLSPAKMIQGLVDFRREFAGQIWLEILLAKGYNDAPDEIEGLLAASARIQPDLVQLNTVVRPPAVDGVEPVSHEFLSRLAGRFACPAQVIAPPTSQGGGDRGGMADQVVEMTNRRPCTLSDLVSMTGLSRERTQALVAELMVAGRLRLEEHDNRNYYRGI